MSICLSRIHLGVSGDHQSTVRAPTLGLTDYHRNKLETTTVESVKKVHHINRQASCGPKETLRTRLQFKQSTWTYRTLRLCTWLGKLENPTQLANVFLTSGCAAPMIFDLTSGFTSGSVSVAVLLEASGV